MRQPPVRIPLDFDTAVGGLLQVDPKGLPKTAAEAKETDAKKAAAKSAADACDEIVKTAEAKGWKAPKRAGKSAKPKAGKKRAKAKK